MRGDDAPLADPRVRAAFAADAATLGIALDAPALDRFERLLEELARWNRAYNLTAIEDPARMLKAHLLDSLSIRAALHGARIADAGTGAGFPGLPLAIATPEREFTLIDSNGKKIRFVAHAIRTLGLANARAVHARLGPDAAAPAARAHIGGPFDTIVSRAFASLDAFARAVAALLAPGGRLLAMKGRRPDEELAALGPEWRVLGMQRLAVPGLDDEQRHLVTLERAKPQ